jgi:hypothetical protein
MRLLVGMFAGMALWPATALAGTSATGGYVMHGPALAGSEAVWVTGSGAAGAPLAVRIAPPDGPARTLWTGPHAGHCQHADSLTASPGYVAFVYSHSPADESGCGYRGRTRLVVLRTNGTPVAVAEPDPEPPGEACMPIGASLDGALLAVERWNCGDHEIAVANLGTGAVEDAGIPRDLSGWVRRGFTLAGSYLAYHQPASDGPGRIVVFDREAQEEAYSVSLDPWMPDDAWPIEFTGRLALQDDGALAVTVQDPVFHEKAQLIGASVAEPAARLLRTDVAPVLSGAHEELAIAGGRIAVRRPGPKDYVLVDHASGAVTATFDRYEPNPCDPEGYGIDWDGTRLAWVNEGIRNEPAPATPSTPGAPIDPMTCPTPDDGSDPATPTTPSAPSTSAAPAGGSPLAHVSTVGTQPRAPARCRVPRLKGRTLRAAKRMLKARRCRLGKVKRGRAARRGKVVVVRQSPRAGARRPAGTRIRVTLGRRR